MYSSNDFLNLEQNDNLTLIDEDISVPAVVENIYIRNFILSGNCYCTIENIKTGNNFTYKIKRNKDKSNMYFVNVASGLGEIYCGYFYVNADLIDYRKGANGKVDEQDIRIQALLYVLNNSNRLPSYVLVQHFGNCVKCGCVLKGSESVRSGFCSDCLNKM